MGRFDYTSADGTRVVGWRNLAAADHLPVVISNGLGTPPTAWPTVVRNGGGFRVATWYYRGTGGGDRPVDESRIAIEDHVADMLACSGGCNVEAERSSGRIQDKSVTARERRRTRCFAINGDGSDGMESGAA